MVERICPSTHDSSAGLLSLMASVSCSNPCRMPVASACLVFDRDGLADVRPGQAANLQMLAHLGHVLC